MSFSVTFRANAGHGVHEFEALCATVRASDAVAVAAGSQDERVADVHRGQLRLAMESIEQICESHPQVSVVGTISGHGSVDGSGGICVSYAFEPLGAD